MKQHGQALAEKYGEKDYFILFPPLGTKEALEMQKELGIPEPEEDEIRPTGKTGVAFGLVRSRKGSRIKVIDRDTTADSEAPFQYYLGSNRKGKFRSKIDRAVPYNLWSRFIDAEEEDFEIYYTDEPVATRGDMTIIDAKRLKLRLDETVEDGWVYIRKLKPTQIEYVAATEAEIKNKNYTMQPVKVELG